MQTSLEELRSQKKAIDLQILKLKQNSKKNRYNELPDYVIAVRKENAAKLSTAFRTLPLTIGHYRAVFNLPHLRRTEEEKIKMSYLTVAILAADLMLAHSQVKRMLHGQGPIREPHLSTLNRLFSIDMVDETKINNEQTEELSQWL